VTASRRALLSAAAVTLLAGCADLVEKADHPSTKEDDVATLNAILGLEYQAIDSYRQASSLLSREERALAERCVADHEHHAEALASAIRRLGGEPVAPQPARGLAGQLRTADDGRRLAAALEKGIAEAYLGAVPALSSRDLARAAAAVLAVETGHWTLWRERLGEPPLPPFLTG
jgi:rubrerythrin